MLDKEMLRQTLGFLQHYNVYEKNKSIYKEAIDEKKNDEKAAFRMSQMIAEHLEGRKLSIYSYWLSIASFRGSPQAQYLLSTYYLDEEKEKEAYDIFALMANNPNMPNISRRYALEKLSLYYLKTEDRDNYKKAKEGFESIFNEDKRNKNACYYLSYCYLNGIGTEADIDKAKEIYSHYLLLCKDSLNKTKIDYENINAKLR